MYYYGQDGAVFCALEDDLALPRCPAPAEKVPLTFLFSAPPEGRRCSFAVTDPRQLTAEEGVAWLDSRRLPDAPTLDAPVARAIENGELRAVNYRHPFWRRAPLVTGRKTGKKRLHLLAVGDVGSTMLLGLKLLGGDVLDTIGICDLDPKVTERWEFELNQVVTPEDPQALPRVEVVAPEQLFDCDMFVFAASKGVPPLGAKGDVRMAQFEANRGLVEHFARQAREAGFSGLFAVVSDPVDPLCKAAYLASNRGEDGRFDGRGLLPEQIQGYGLGVMHGRAAYYARKDPRFAAYLTDGRAFGPHGEGLVIANSIGRYDDTLSRELTEKTKTANLRLRELGFKPYVAPALSSGALSLLATIRGQWHYGSVFLGGVYFGVRNRYTSAGQEIESLELPQALMERLEETWEDLARIL